MQKIEAVIDFKQPEMVSSAAIMSWQTERGIFTVKQTVDGKNEAVQVGITAGI